MLLVLVVFVLMQDNALAGVRYYLIPDVSKVTASVVNGALSQAFFSLSLGMGIMLTYGSYIESRADIPGAAKLVALTDTLVAFTAGLMILPAIFSFNPQTNPAELSDSSISMIFTFLPKIFLALQASIGYFGASVVASVFFLLVFFAAITSLVSIFEVPVAALIDERDVGRKRALFSLGAVLIVLAVLCSLSFGMNESLTSFIRYAGADKSFFDVIYDVFYDTILPLNGFLVCIFVIYRWKKHHFNAALDEGAPSYKGSFFERYVDFSLGTFIPVILLVIFLNTVSTKFFAVGLLDLF
jgi:NSS family neurotransmitter:Na+ symporter